MARYKPVDLHLSKLLPVRFSEQILPGTFEYALNWLVDHEIDLSVFDARYRNDETGASAYHPGVLLKVVLLGYARGLTSSRSIERACRENIVFMALSGDSAPHFTTIAGFVAKLPGEITAVFRDVLLVCDEQGLIGKELFAVDGCKLASKTPAPSAPDKRTPCCRLSFFNGSKTQDLHPQTPAMKARIDSREGRLLYSRRLGIVEPVFGNLHNHHLRRFTLRTRRKVHAQ
jgi:transposase